MSVPPAHPSSPRTPPSPKTLDPPRSSPSPTSTQQQQDSAEPIEVPPSTQLEDKQDDRAMDKAEAKEKQFQGQKVVAKETDFQKERADQAYEEIDSLRTSLQLITKERDSGVRENKNLLKDLLDAHKQLDKKEAQCHELIKNEKKNQEPALVVASTSHSATMNTLMALQEELQIKKLQRQLLVSGFMSQTAQHEAKLPHLPDMPDIPSTSQHNEEHQGPAPGALDVRGDLEQEIKDMPKGPAKEFLLHEKKVMESMAMAFLQPEEQKVGLQMIQQKVSTVEENREQVVISVDRELMAMEVFLRWTQVEMVLLEKKEEQEGYSLEMRELYLLGCAPFPPLPLVVWTALAWLQNWLFNLFAQGLLNLLSGQLRCPLFCNVFFSLYFLQIFNSPTKVNDLFFLRLSCLGYLSFFLCLLFNL
ncbi:hypothetical protein L7F22_045915 [Adiantum nelumboides]|nr:hypothetical protein [Adiantum nelumboides]